MVLDPWYKIVTPRKEVREGRSFSPDEFAIALEQVVAGTAPEDYRDPLQFFSRTCFTRDLKEHAGMVLRRLAGETGNTAPVLTLVTQFGGGKTHTLAALCGCRPRSKRLFAAERSDRVRSCVRPLMCGLSSAAGQDGDLRIGSKSSTRAQGSAGRSGFPGPDLVDRCAHSGRRLLTPPSPVSDLSRLH